MTGEGRLDGWRRTRERHRHEIKILRVPEHFPDKCDVVPIPEWA